jgi:predicted tellurium resistance membrane protein TerC
MEILLQPETWIAFATLTALEVVLGIDNIIFISILAGKLPTEQRDRARKVGLALAAITRLALLFSLAWIMGLTDPLFAVFGQEISWRDIILIGGGLFLIGKSTLEIHEKLEGPQGDKSRAVAHSFASVIVQIMILDIVFSLDSIITAVGMVEHVSIMAAAIIVAVIIMILFAGAVSRFVDRHPTIKMLALSFLVLIGMALLGEGFGLHIPKGYIYFAMGFAVGVEMLNLRLRKVSSKPVQLHDHYRDEDGQQ